MRPHPSSVTDQISLLDRPSDVVYRTKGGRSSEGLSMRANPPSLLAIQSRFSWSRKSQLMEPPGTPSEDVNVVKCPLRYRTRPPLYLKPIHKPPEASSRKAVAS